ncbi:PepSY domain-containing protein [Kroppenstedtia eburnea]|uniref:PepSY domain-containing protein n=1 Tax=Kroppenstedtia eburnea TaxID=714067 RepID=UPI00363EC6BF
MSVKKIVILGVSSFLLLAIGFFYYLQSGREEIQQPIPSQVDLMSAKDLVKAAHPFVKEYGGNDKFDLGEVNLMMKGSSPEKAELWYRGQAKGEEVPRIITVEMDLEKKQVLRIREQDRDSKIEPVAIDLKKWRIDSKEAIQIATDTLKKEDEQLDYQVDTAYLIGESKPPVWIIRLSAAKKYYSVFIDMQTGKVRSKELLPSE